MKVAIVGSEGKYWIGDQEEKVKALVRDILLANYPYSMDTWMTPENRNVILVSGHCPKGGVDIWAEEVARELGFRDEEMLIHKPGTDHWDDRKGLKGYRSRNIDIAKDCDVLFCIEPKIHIESFGHAMSRYTAKTAAGVWHRRSGGMWTLDYARRLGKEVHVVVIE